MYYPNSFRSQGGSRRDSNDSNSRQPSQRRISNDDSTRSVRSRRSVGGRVDSSSSLNSRTKPVRKGSLEGEGSESSTSHGSTSQERQRRRERELRRERSQKKKSSRRNVEEENWDQTKDNNDDASDDENTDKKEDANERQKWRMSITEEDLEIDTKAKRRGSFSHDFFYGEHLSLLKKRGSKEKDGLEKVGLEAHLDDVDSDADSDEGSIEDVFSLADTSTLSQGTERGAGAPLDSSVPVDAHDPKKASIRSLTSAPADSIYSYFKTFRRGSAPDVTSDSNNKSDLAKDTRMRRNSTGFNSSSKDGLSIDPRYHPDKHLFDHGNDSSGAMNYHDSSGVMNYHDSCQTVDTMSYWESINDFNFQQVAQNQTKNPSVMQKIQDKLQLTRSSSKSVVNSEEGENNDDNGYHSEDHDEEKHYDYNYGKEGHFPNTHYRSNNPHHYVVYDKEEVEYDRRLRYSFTEKTNRGGKRGGLMKYNWFGGGLSQYKWFGDGLCSEVFRRVGAGFAIVLAIVGTLGLTIGFGVEELNNGHHNHDSHNTRVPYPSMSLAETCRMDKHACVLGCAPGSCCFMHPTNDAKNCFHQNERVCTKYGPCHILLDDYEMGAAHGNQKGTENQGGISSAGFIYTSLSIVPEPPTNLPQICSLFSGDAGSMDAVVQNPTDCRTSCLTASCCLESGPNLNCASNPHNKDYCPIYQKHCSNLSPPMLDLSDYDGMIPPPPHDLRSICSVENTSTNDGKSQCEDACDPGLCCVGMGNPIDCALLPPEQKAATCLAYKRHCATVWPSNVYVKEKNYLQKPMEQWCSTPNNIVSKRTRQVCSEVCEEVKCCWEDGPSNCQSFNGDKCDAFSFCQNYQVDASLVSSTKDIYDVSTFPPIVPEESIADHCSPTSIANLDVLEDCKSMCAGGGCCLYPSTSTREEDSGIEENDCYLEYGDICALYQPCLKLDLSADDEGWSTRSIPKSPTEYLCQSNDSLVTDEERQICLDVCSAGSCCYDDDPSTNCFTENEDICWLYEPCRANAIVPPAPVDLEETCDFEAGNEMAKEDCIHACQPSACCWEGLSVDENGNFEAGLCYESNEAACSAYKAPCSVVEPYLGYGMGWQAESGLLPVLEACSSHNLETDEGVSRCREECEPSWCCIAEDPLSCRDVYPHFCNQYEPICGPLLRLGLLDIDEYDEEDINSICSMKNVITVQGKARCEEKCVAASCCYFSEGEHDQNGAEGSHKKYGCREEKAAWCEEMAACNVLIEVTALTSTTENGIEIDESTLLIPYAPSNIGSLCAKDKVSSFTGRLECEDVCLPSECCYDDEGTESCRQTNSGACDSYSPWCDGLIS